MTPWTIAHQTPVSMGFSRQEYWNGLLCPPPGDLPDWGSNLHLLCLLHWQADSLPLVPPGKPNTQYDMCAYLVCVCLLSNYPSKWITLIHTTTYTYTFCVCVCVCARAHAPVRKYLFTPNKNIFLWLTLSLKTLRIFTLQLLNFIMHMFIHISLERIHMCVYA